jgi:hypothetical protein
MAHLSTKKIYFNLSSMQTKLHSNSSQSGPKIFDPKRKWETCRSSVSPSLFSLFFLHKMDNFHIGCDTGLMQWKGIAVNFYNQ